MKKIVFIEIPYMGSYEEYHVIGYIDIINVNGIIPRENEYVRLEDKAYKITSVIYEYAKQTIVMYVEKITNPLN